MKHIYLAIMYCIAFVSLGAMFVGVSLNWDLRVWGLLLILSVGFGLISNHFFDKDDEEQAFQMEREKARKSRSH